MPMPPTLSEDAIKRAAETVRAVHAGHSGTMAEPPTGTNRALYEAINPLALVDFETKVKLLSDIDAYARARDPRVRAGVGLGRRRVAGGADHPRRRLARLRRPSAGPPEHLRRGGDGDRMESGGHGVGGRTSYEAYFDPAAWQGQVDEALRQALVNLDSVAAPAGEMTVVLGNGWPGILLHEAIGHGLEGDFNRKKTSAFAGLLGQRIASPGVTVVDDGTIDAAAAP